MSNFIRAALTTRSTELRTASDTLCRTSAAVPGLLSRFVNFRTSDIASLLYNPSRVSRCEYEHAAEPEVPPWDFFFLSPPFLTARCELRVEENQPAVRVRGGAAAAADEREGGQRGSHGARYCTAANFRFPPRRRREFNHLFVQRKSAGGSTFLFNVFNM